MGNEQSAEATENITTLLARVRAEVDSEARSESPLTKERNGEEKTYRLLETLSVPKITRVRFFLDSDKDFTVVVEGGSEEGRFVICVILQDHMKITCNECRVMQAALRFTERGTGLTEKDFRNWASQFEKVGKARVDKNSQGILIMNVRPNPMSHNRFETLPGQIQKTGVAFDNDEDVVVCFATDVEKYVISVTLELEERSFADLQCQATHDALSIAEQGDKMDDSIFLQHCARLQKKYKLVKVTRSNDVMVAYVRPSKLEHRDACVTLRSEFTLPPVTEGDVQWDPATEARVRRQVGSGGSGGNDPNIRRHLVEALIEGLLEGNQPQTSGDTPPAASATSSSSSQGSLPQYDGGRIRAAKLLKESGQANVYKGSMDSRGQTTEVAIKVFHNEDDWRECKQELRTLLSIPPHPNVMEVLDFYEVPKPAFVMRFVNGGDLRDRLDKGRLTLSEAGSLLDGIGEGLRHLHSRNIVHRDMKSPNILLEKVGSTVRPVIIDLALGSSLQGDATHAKTEGIKGTPIWMAPEMITQNEYSAKSDMYAVGIIMWEMLTGKIPFMMIPPVPPLQLIFQIATGLRPEMSALSVAGLSSAQERLMTDLWAEAPNDRPDAELFLARLRSTLPMGSLTTLTANPSRSGNNDNDVAAGLRALLAMMAND